MRTAEEGKSAFCAKRYEGKFVHILRHQSPTRLGWFEVQALGKSVSRAVTNPWITLKPDTLAVIAPRAPAASAFVDKWPSEMVPAITSEY